MQASSFVPLHTHARVEAAPCRGNAATRRTELLEPPNVRYEIPTVRSKDCEVLGESSSLPLAARLSTPQVFVWPPS